MSKRNIIIQKQENHFLRFLFRYGPTIAVLVFCFLARTVFSRENGYDGIAQSYVGYLLFGAIVFLYEIFLITMGPRQVNGVKTPIPITHFVGVLFVLFYMSTGNVICLFVAAACFLKDIWSDFIYTKVKFEFGEESFTMKLPFKMKKEIFYREINSLDYGNGLFAFTILPVIKVKYGGNLLDVKKNIPNAYIGDEWLSDIINEKLVKYGNSGIKVYDDYVNKFGYKYYEVTDDGIYCIDLPKQEIFLPWSKVSRLDYGMSWHPSSTKNFIMVHGRSDILDDVYFEFEEDQMVVAEDFEGNRNYRSIVEEIKTHCMVYPKIDVTNAFADKYQYAAIWGYVDERPALGYDTVEGLLPDKFNLQ